MWHTPFCHYGWLWRPLVDEWVVKRVVQWSEGPVVQIPLGKTLDPRWRPGDQTKQSAKQVQTVYHLPQMDGKISQKGWESLSSGTSGDQKSCCVEGRGCKWRAEWKSFIFVAAAEAAGTVTLFRRAECLCIDLADRENGEIFHMLYQGHRRINSLRPASSVLSSSRPRRHRL